MPDNNKTSSGIGQVANWSWWWVTSPLWIPAAIVVGLGLLVLIITVVKNGLD